MKFLPCLNIIDIDAFKIVETDTSDIGYGGILNKENKKLSSLLSSPLVFGILFKKNILLLRKKS